MMNKDLTSGKPQKVLWALWELWESGVHGR